MHLGPSTIVSFGVCVDYGCAYLTPNLLIVAMTFLSFQLRSSGLRLLISTASFVSKLNDAGLLCARYKNFYCTHVLPVC